jgi:hypothetical protein
MSRRISFSENVSIFNENGDIEIQNTYNKSSLKRNKTPSPRNRYTKSYTPQNAYTVAERMEKEIKNPKLLELRWKQELIVENLLARNNMFVQINKVYRLSNEAIFVMKKRLLFST